jgi:hypothetical protein
MLEHLLKNINQNFGFCKKVSINRELMQSNAAQMAMYGIIIGIPQLTLMLLANIKTATNPTMAMNSARPCMPYAKSTDTTTCTRQLWSSSFSRS